MAVIGTIIGILPDHRTGCTVILDRVDIRVHAVVDLPGDNDIAVGIHCRSYGTIIAGIIVIIIIDRIP